MIATYSKWSSLNVVFFNLKEKTKRWEGYKHSVDCVYQSKFKKKI